MAGDSTGLFLLFTGNGKGKTTAALGLAWRALGHGKKVAVVQFIKGSWHYGEIEAAKHFGDLLDFHVMGRGFTWKSDDLDKDRDVAGKAWAFAKGAMQGNQYDLLILDELTYLVLYNMVDEEEVLEAIKSRPGNLHVVVTGRGASEQMIEAADLVTEMVEVKHPYKKGVKAQQGIEF